MKNSGKTIKNCRKKSVNLGIGEYDCNNHCIFCVDGERRKLSFPPAKKIFDLLKKWRKKTDSILFCGPEPTINPDLCNFIKKSKDLGYTEIRLNTNGRLLSYFNFAKNLMESGVDEICVSFHGSNKRIQEAQTRAPGSFEQTLRGCKNLSLLKSHHKFKWYINFTFNKINASDLYKFLKLTLPLKGLNGINISAIMPKGRALEYFDIVVPTYSGLAKTFKLAINRLEKSISSKQNLEKEFNIRIIGIPFCLMKGYEKYIGPYNELYLSFKDARNKKSKDFSEELDQEQIKSPQCQNCSYYEVCTGVWEEYAKRRGWKEFKPII